MSPRARPLRFAGFYFYLVSYTAGSNTSLASGPFLPSSTPAHPITQDQNQGAPFTIWQYDCLHCSTQFCTLHSIRPAGFLSDIKVENTLTAVCSVVLWICLLLLFLWNRPWDAPCMSLRPLSNIFSSCNPGINHSAILSSHKQPTPFSELSFLLQINHELPDSSELFRPGGGRSQVPGQHASVGLLPLPLSGLLFRLQTCGSAGCGPLFPQIGRGEARECRSTSGKHEAIAEATSSFWTGGSVSREVGKIQEALEAALLMKKN